MGQAFVPEVIESIHKQTAGQPVLVNRFAQILTEALDIPKTEPITMSHFTTAHAQLLEENNVNITHLITNVRKNPRFESMLMRIVVFDHRHDPEPRLETETIDDVTVRSYVIPVLQEQPSDERLQKLLTFIPPSAHNFHRLHPDQQGRFHPPARTDRSTSRIERRNRRHSSVRRDIPRQT